MSEILGNPTWQFIITLVVAILAVVIPIMVSLKQRQRKGLSYQISSNTPLLSVDSQIKKDLQILYQGEPVQDVNLVLLELINSGNTPILADDFEYPVSIDFGQEANILTSEIVKTKPDGLVTSLKVEKGKIIVNPLLLNQGDAISIRAIVTKLSMSIKVGGRIVGVKNIKQLSDDPVGSVLALFIAFVFAAIGFIVLTIQNITNLSASSWGFLMFFGGYIIILTIIFADKRIRKITFSSTK